MGEPSQGHGMRAFAQENGWLLLTSKVLSGGGRRVRDRLLARRLHAPGLRLGRTPKLLGLRHMRLGRNLSAGHDLWMEAVTEYCGMRFDPLLTLGDDCNLSDNVHIACTNQISIGDGLLCGSRVLISDHSHGEYGGVGEGSDPGLRPGQRPLSTHKRVWIGRNVWLGDGVAVLGGASIGDGAVIGANAVVTGAIPAQTIAAGAPARPLKQWNVERRQWVAWSSDGPL